MNGAGARRRLAGRAPPRSPGRRHRRGPRSDPSLSIGERARHDEERGRAFAIQESQQIAVACDELADRVVGGGRAPRTRSSASRSVSEACEEIGVAGETEQLRAMSPRRAARGCRSIRVRYRRRPLVWSWQVTIDCDQVRRIGEAGFAIVQSAGEERQRQRALVVRDAERRERRRAALDRQIEPARSALRRSPPRSPAGRARPRTRRRAIASRQPIPEFSRVAQPVQLGQPATRRQPETGHRFGSSSRAVASKSCMLRRWPPAASRAGEGRRRVGSRTSPARRRCRSSRRRDVRRPEARGRSHRTPRPGCRSQLSV